MSGPLHVAPTSQRQKSSLLKTLVSSCKLRAETYRCGACSTHPLALHLLRVNAPLRQIVVLTQQNALEGQWGETPMLLPPTRKTSGWQHRTWRPLWRAWPSFHTLDMGRLLLWNIASSPISQFTWSRFLTFQHALATTSWICVLQH
jgi:hypothetical protein